MIYTELNASGMKDLLKKVGRDNFTEGALNLYSQFMFSKDLSEEFNPIDFDCTFIEFNLSCDASTRDILEEYGYLLGEKVFESEGDKIESLVNKLHENTLVMQDSNILLFDYNF